MIVIGGFMLNRFSGMWFEFLVILLLGVGVAQAESGYHAKLISSDVPSYMIGGEEYSVYLSYKNAGSQAWKVNEGITLSWNSPQLNEMWGGLVVGDLFDVPVSPGETIDIEFTVLAPITADIFDLGWQLFTPDGLPFGEPVEVLGVQIETAKNQAKMMMQIVPDELVPSAHFTALIQVKNIGRTTWDAKHDYHLAMLSEWPWPIKRIDLADDIYVTPGEQATFRAVFEAPKEIGRYAFKWQMRHKGVYFGEPSSEVLIQVGKVIPERAAHSAEFIYQGLAEVMLGGDFYEVVVQYKNSSPYTWRRGEVVLTSPEGKGMLWAVDEVEMSEERVSPGGFVSFHFTVQAPFDAGVYPLQWQLKHVEQGLFGEPTPKRLIEAK